MGIAEAGASCQSDFDDLVGARQCDEFAGAAIVRHVAIGIEHHAAHAAAGQTAVQALHCDADTFGVNGRQCRQSVVVQFAQARAHAAAAAMFAGAAGIGDEGFLQHQHRRARFHQLDRCVGGGGRVQQRGFAVAVLRCALAGAHEEVVGIDGAVRLAAVDVDRDRQSGRGLHLCRGRIGERAEDVGRDVPADTGAQIHRRWLVAVQDRAFRCLHGERTIAAGVAAHLRTEDALHRIGRVCRGVAVGAVQAALRQLRRRAGEVQFDRVALHGELQRIVQALAQRVVPDLRAVHAVRQRTDRIAHGVLGASLHHAGERAQIVHAVLVHECEQPFGTERVGGNEGVDVAQHLLVLAHILGDQREQVVVRHARAIQHHRRDLDAFLVDLARAQGVLGAADVADMADRAGQRHQRAVAEHRRDDGDVEQVAGAEPRVVGDQHVAWLQRLGREFLEQRLHRARQGQVEHRHGARRMGQRIAARVEQIAGEVLRLGDDEREGGAADRVPHLLDHGDETAPHDFE